MRRLTLYLASLIPAALLLLAFSGHRRGSFLLLRLVVSIGAALLALTTYKQHTLGWMWAMLGILIRLEAEDAGRKPGDESLPSRRLDWRSQIGFLIC